MNIKAEEEADTDDEIDTQKQEKGSASDDNITLTVSASTTDEDGTVVLKLFEKLNSCIEKLGIGGTLTNDIETMIKSNQHLVNEKCPQEMGEIEVGRTIMEAVCCLDVGPDTRDLLYDLVRLGGKATDNAMRKSCHI